ncbi:SoxR reducing system RseC family protein [Rhodocyclus gracilis]|nr:SoxR reducing system RseC family protein [Rhodocyclus gracilis]
MKTSLSMIPIVSPPPASRASTASAPLSSTALDSPVSPQRPRVEGIARVVAVDCVDGERVWLEPEQTTSCGGCAAASRCGAKGVGTLASRLEARRFPLSANVASPPLRIGERVVIGVEERSLVRASLTAYAIPLLTAFAAGGVAEGLVGSDAVTMFAMLGGLGAGLLLAGGVARRLSARGELAPRYLRRARADESCSTDSTG